MGDSILFRGGHCNNSTPKQLKSLREACIDDSVIDSRRCLENVNTCGKGIEELLSTYPLYEPQKGLYNSWGGIIFPWEISDITPNLFIEQTNDQWKVARYRAIVAYAAGSKILRIEDDGYTVVLYEALEDIYSYPGAFDSEKWEKICSVKTTIPAGLPSLEELSARFQSYLLRFFDEDWGNVESGWDIPLKDQSIEACPEEDDPLTLIDDKKECLKDSSSDEWDETRVRREFFYREGDVVLVEGECGDVLCLYVALKDIPATKSVFDEYKKFKIGEYWQKIYCVSTGRNKCLEYQRTKTPEEAYDVVEIGSKGHYVEMPKPYEFGPKQELLNNKLSQTSPKVLSSREIEVLDGVLKPDCLKS